jgi:imidazolonepropionase-like amidohydrolase
VVDGGFLLPGLVDVHTHPGTRERDEPFSDAVLREQLIEHRDAGVLLVRTPGSAGRIPAWVDDDEDLPRVRSAGRWLATPGRFFPGFGRDVSEADLVRAAVEEAAASSGWCKVIGDWKPDSPAVPLELLTAVVQAVHESGGKVAVHCQTADGSRNAVLAGADSLEHGMHLDPDLVDRMAAQGTAFVPTLSVFAAHADERRAAEPSAGRDWWLAGWDGMLPNVRAAHEAGVTVLAGTDSFPCGTVMTEVAWLVRAGLPIETALGAASWSARSWLGLPGLVDGGPADLTAYATDPALDPSVLARPDRIILRGRVIA